MNPLARAYRQRLFWLGQNAPISLKAQRGTVVACLMGELWVTQDGDQRDYFVPRGYRYCCSKAGLIVVNSFSGISHALVYWTNPQQCPDFICNDVRIDHHSRQRLVGYARNRRAQVMRRVARRYWRRIANVWRRIVKRCFHTS